jgi:hypothetical protein
VDVDGIGTEYGIDDDEGALPPRAGHNDGAVEEEEES